MSVNRRDALVASAGLVLAATTPSSASAQSGLKDIDTGVTVAPDDAAEIWAVLDAFITNYRIPVLDRIDKHFETLIFPHVRIASHKVVIAPVAKSYRDFATNPAEVDQLMQGGWDHSDWTKRKIVQADKEKVHVVTTFNRCRKDNSVIAAEDSLHILERVGDRWGIRGRSSFAK